MDLPSGRDHQQAVEDPAQAYLNMNSVDFMSETLSMEPYQVLEILQSDDLQCTSEDQVVEFVKEYLLTNKEAAQIYAMQILNSIRYDHVSTEMLI